MSITNSAALGQRNRLFSTLSVSPHSCNSLSLRNFGYGCKVSNTILTCYQKKLSNTQNCFWKRFASMLKLFWSTSILDNTSQVLVPAYKTTCFDQVLLFNLLQPSRLFNHINSYRNIKFTS